MYRDLKISLYLPCRNESQNLEKIFARIPDFIDEKIIISNKSTDDTVQKAKELGFAVYEDNRATKGIGYGYAHMTGIKNSTGDIIIAADGDAEHPIEGLEHIIKHMLALNLDFLYCSRYPLTDPSQMSFKQKLGVALLNLEIRVLYGIRIHDALSGMWLVKKEIKDQLKLTEGGWNLSPEIKINALLNKDIKFGEYIISSHKRSAGVTKQQYLKTGLTHMLWILKNRYIHSKEVETYTKLHKKDSPTTQEPKLYFNLG